MRLGLSRTRNRNLKGVGIFFTLFFLIFIIWLVFTKLQPSFIEYAKVYSNNIANEVVNSAVDDVFVKEEYQSLAQVMENSSENIKAIETDTAKINRLKSAIIQSMQKNIDSHKSDTVYVPLEVPPIASDSVIASSPRVIPPPLLLPERVQALC